MILIGLMGKARSGKTTVAEHWRDTKGFEIVSFADALKEMVEGALWVNPPPYDAQFAEVTAPNHPEDFDWHDLLYYNRIPFTRWLLQFIGTDIIRDRVYADFWVARGTDKIEAATGNLRDVVIPDVRFRNEANAIRECGGLIVELIRTTPHVGVEVGVTHASETEMASIEPDVILNCPDGVFNLKAMADRFLEDLRVRN